MRTGLVILGVMIFCTVALALTVPAKRCVKWEERGGAGIGATYSVCLKRAD